MEDGSGLTPSSFDPLLLWQLIDSAFPTGGFAHSGGVEAAWQHGLLGDGDDLRTFIRIAIRQAAHGPVPIALAVFAEPDSFQRWDEFYDATLTNHVVNRASRAQGRALLSTAAQTFNTPMLTLAYDAVRRTKTSCHLAPAFGLCAAALGVAAVPCAQAFLFLTARGLVTAAVRLGLIGPLEGQRLQAEEAPHVGAAVEVALQRSPDRIAQTAFLADLLQGTQDRLYSRLFQS